MSDLRKSLIRLAHQRPELRAELLPLLDKTAAGPVGKPQIAIMEYLTSHEGGVFELTDLAKAPSLRGVHFEGILSAAQNLKKKGLISLKDGKVRKLSSEMQKTAAEEIGFEALPVELQAFIHDLGLQPKAVFEGIHGYIVSAEGPAFHGQGHRLSKVFLKKLLTLPEFRWIESTPNGKFNIGM